MLRNTIEPFEFTYTWELIELSETPFHTSPNTFVIMKTCSLIKRIPQNFNRICNENDLTNHYYLVFNLHVIWKQSLYPSRFTSFNKSCSNGHGGLKRSFVANETEAWSACDCSHLLMMLPQLPLLLLYHVQVRDQENCAK